MTRAEDMRAEADLVELEEELGTAKKKTAELKDKVRAARRAAREAREG